MKKQLKKWSHLLTVVLFCSASLLTANESMSAENKLLLGMGYFSVTGKNQITGKSVNVPGLGAFQIRYLRAITPHLEVGAGYTVSYDKILGGNSIFGLDVGINYFPFTATHDQISQNSNTKMSIIETYRPFAGLSFVQRNFGGIQTSYSGFAMNLGSEYHLNPMYDLVSAVRYAAISASSEATAKELSLMFGIIFGF